MYLFPTFLFAVTNIPAQAWSRDINAGGYLDGSPIGGFGAGTCTWNFAGDFYLSRLNIAAAPTTWTNNNPYTIDNNCHFYMYQKPAAGSVTTNMLNAATLGSGQATYYSLFPKSWVDYYGTKFPCKARVTQFTPLIPNDYVRSSFPEGIYEWDLYNPTCTSTDVAIMLTWDNTFGGASASVTTNGSNTGIVLTRSGGSATTKSQGEFTLASTTSSGVSITYQSAASAAALQTAFNTAGLLGNTVGANTIGAIAFKVTLAPGQSVKIPIVMAWDIPLCQPGSGAQWYREYTRTYGKTGLNSFSVANDALNNYSAWESSIDTWQGGILGGPTPNWFKQMLFNELYYYVVGGTIWEAGQYGSATFDAGPDMFSSLECYIYTFYGTSDVRFYSSWVLAENWPNIDKQEVEQFCDSVVVSPSQTLPRPAAIGTTAHDFGGLNDVFTRWNSYTYRDSTTWKDLNSKLVLMVYRDWEITGKSDSTFLNYCWPAVQLAMTKVHSQCVSAGVTYNLPISTGIDQTYDDLGLTGETAYCGSLYLAACEAAKAMATQQGNAGLANTYQGWLTMGQADFEGNLWNATGNYYNIDTGSGAGGVTGVARIMSDQLCGQWYAKACGLADVVPAAHAVSAWQTVHDNNWAKFDAGAHGMVNVMTSAGAIDTSTPQSQEAWVGTSWGGIAGMIQQGMFTQAVSIGNSLYNTIWNTGSMWFRTPEAWRTGLGGIRAAYYMRANCIWAAKHAYDVTSPCGGACTPVPSLTPTRTATLGCALTPTATPTNTPSPTRSSTATASPTNTATRTATTTPTNSPTRTATTTPTVSPTATFSSTATRTPSSTPTRTPTNTPTNSSTFTPLPLSTFTPTSTNSPTASPSRTPSSTPSSTPSQTFTRTATSSPTSSPSSTPTLTATLTVSNTATRTPSASPTPTGTVPPTSTATNSPTRTATSSPTATPVLTATSTRTPSNSPTASMTASFTNSATFSPTQTATASPTSTPTTSPTATASNTDTFTATITPTGTLSPTFTFTFTSTPTNSPTLTISPTPTATFSRTATDSPTSSPTASPSRTPTSSPTATVSLTSTRTFTSTATNSSTASFTSSSTMTNTFTLSNTPSVTQTSTKTPTSTFTVTSSNTPSFTPSYTSSFTPTVTPSPTSTYTPVVTPQYTEVVILPPYPNPSDGTGFISVEIHVPGSAEVHWSVFTTAFRKIVWGTSTVNGIGVIQWDQKDKTGTPVAHGLYYLRVEAKGDFGETKKILKILMRP